MTSMRQLVQPSEPSRATRSPGAARPAVPFDSRVLLVEDNPVNLELVSRMLARLGCRVDIAADGAAAADLAARERFDLILMDCEMPLVDGFEATGRIRNCELARGRPRTPILALTAHAAADAYGRCVEAGMDGVLSKPINRRQLMAGLETWLAVRPSAASEAPTIDGAIIEGIRGLAGDGSTILMHVVSQFEAVGPDLAAAIRDGSQCGEAAAVARAAHSRRSSAGALGANGVAHLCVQIEKQARDASALPDAVVLERLDVELARALRNLRALAENAA